MAYLSMTLDEAKADIEREEAAKRNSTKPDVDNDKLYDLVMETFKLNSIKELSNPVFALTHYVNDGQCPRALFRWMRNHEIYLREPRKAKKKRIYTYQSKSTKFNYAADVAKRQWAN